MMQAMYTPRYGGPEVMQILSVEKPLPKDNEVLIKIKATAVNVADCRLRKADPWAVRLFFGLTKPRNGILGGVFSGEIEAIGKNVTSYKIGDTVFGSSALSYGFGAYGQYKCLPEDGIFCHKPANLLFVEAATVPFGALTALDFLQRAKVGVGTNMLIYGASGSVGSAAVQLAKAMGAKVTAVCSTSNVDMVQSLGADVVLDYVKEDLTQHHQKYDIVFDTVNKVPISLLKKWVNPSGSLVLGAADFPSMMAALWLGMTSSVKVITGMIKETKENLLIIRQLIESGKYKPVIDRIYPFHQIPEGHAYAEGGHKKGNIAINMSDITY